MLHTLTLHNFALIDQYEISFHSGFNVITGETGAGKSLLLDALSLCMGGRADSNMVRHGTNSADLYAQFDLKHHALAKAWFLAHERDWCDGELIIRRQISDNGRSKAWVNGTPVSLSELKSLGALLVNIHSQHAGLELLKPKFIIEWLDSVGGLRAQAKDTKIAYQAWQTLHQQQQNLSETLSQRLDRIDLLTSKLSDIEPLLNIDMAQIEAEYDELSNIESLIQNANLAAICLDNDDEPSAVGLLGRAIKLCEQKSAFSTFAHCSESLSEAQSLLMDVHATLSDYAQNQSANPERLAQLETLMGLAHRLSNKYRLPIQVLIQEAKQWQDELDTLQSMPDTQTLEAEEKRAFEHFVKTASLLDTARQQIAPKLSKALKMALAPLNLPNATCQFNFLPKNQAQYNQTGLSDIELLFSANVGIPAQPLHKIASGGELSRIALIMQLMAAGTQDSKPMLIFDEADTGIGGGTAQVVGSLLRTLGTHQQLLVITHQAQVAAAAHQHLLIKKHHDEKTKSQLSILDTQARILELARMSGGVDIDDTTLAHAKNLFTTSQSTTNLVPFTPYPTQASS